MKNLKAIIIVLIIVLLIGGLGFIVVKNLNSDNKSNGVDSNIKNEEGKTGSTTLDSNKVLVVYFSETGNTQKLAKLISDKVGGDFIRIETVQKYPTNYQDLVDYAEEEKNKNARPELKELNIDLDKYDTILIGYPIWWYQMPMALYTFFDTYDFSGKTIVPFNTHEGSGVSGTNDDIKELEPKANVLKSLAIRGGDMEENQMPTVEKWLNELGFGN